MYSRREVRAGVFVLAGVAALGAVVWWAADVGRLFSPRRRIEVTFRDAQGIKPGSPVRVAGLEAGRVAGVRWSEQEGALAVEVTLEIPAELAECLCQDVLVTVSSTLAGQTFVNISSPGFSRVPLADGQRVRGTEVGLLGDLLGQLGFSAEDKENLRVSLSRLRSLIEELGPQSREIAASLQATAEQMRRMTAQADPEVRGMLARMNEATARWGAMLARLEQEAGGAVVDLRGLLGDNREDVRQTVKNLHTLSAKAVEFAEQDQPKLSALVDNLSAVTARSEALVKSAEQFTHGGNEALAANRAAVDRSMRNMQEATEYMRLASQEVYRRPWRLLMKDESGTAAVQGAYAAARAFQKAASEVDDAAKNLRLAAEAGADKGRLEGLYGKLEETVKNFHVAERQLYQRLGERQ